MYQTYFKQNTFIDALEYQGQVIWFHLTKKSSKDVSNDICFIMILDQSKSNFSQNRLHSVENRVGGIEGRGRKGRQSNHFTVRVS